MIEYTISLEVRVEGPDADWDTVADLLCRRVQGLSLKRGTAFRVASAAIDTASDEPVEPRED